MAESTTKRDWFSTFSTCCSIIVGSRWSFSIAILIVVVWACSGHYFHYSDTWQLVINTGTTIVTFIMVFLIQNTQNRDAKAINLKLNEIIFAIGRAENDLIDAEKLSDEDLAELERKYARIREIYESRKKNRKGGSSENGSSQSPAKAPLGRHNDAQ